MFRMFDAAYAIIIYDVKRGLLVAARDRHPSALLLGTAKEAMFFMQANPVGLAAEIYLAVHYYADVRFVSYRGCQTYRCTIRSLPKHL